MSSKLSALSRLRRIPSELRTRQKYTLEDAIIGSIEETVNRLVDVHAMAGEPLTQAELCEGVTISIPIPVGGTRWDLRLSEIRQAADFAISQNVPLGLIEVQSKLLDLDGWVLNQYTVKTPAWLHPHKELPWSDVPDEMIWVKNVQSWRKGQS